MACPGAGIKDLQFLSSGNWLPYVEGREGMSTPKNQPLTKIIGE